MLHFGKIPKKIGQNLAKKAKFWRILQNFAKIYKKTAKKISIFNEKNEIRERCKGVLCVDRRELSNDYLLAKFGFDTAENEPCKVREFELSGI